MPEDVYFKGIKRKSNIDRLKDAGLSDNDLKALGYKPKKKKTTKKKMGVISRAAKGLKSVFGPGHSPAGRKYLAGEVKKYGK